MIVIDSIAPDCHAHAVAWALKLKGAASVFVFGENYPSRSDISYRGGEDVSWTVSYRGPEANFQLNRDSEITYWARRLGSPILSSEVAEYDRGVVSSESSSLLSSFRAILNDLAGPRAVNNLSLSRRAERKPLQLGIARAVGMSVPETLFSSSKEEIIDFAENIGGKVIFKTNTPVIWRSQQSARQTSYMVYSSILTIDELRNSQNIVLCTGIYQKPIDKAYEVRLVVMGGTQFATKILSQEFEGSKVDWRAAQGFVRNESMPIPATIGNQVKDYMERAGLLFGCFDFIVDEQGNWIFLECNEQGQWLWQEAKCPELTLLDAFAEFIMNPSDSFSYRANVPVSLRNYMESHWNDDLEATLRHNVANLAGGNVTVERNAAKA